MTENRNFLGLPVEGSIIGTERRARQRPLEELAPLMQALLDDEGIDRFGWRQYTPYFNDGEPCVFRAYGLWAVPAGSEADAYDDEEFSSNFEVEYGTFWGSYMGGRWPDQARYDRCKALSDAIISGAFDDVLLEAFGDHARVTVRRSGITVSSYEHE